MNSKLNRRDFIKAASLFGGMFSLGARSFGVQPGTPKKEIKPFAKSVIQIWFWGGPSQIDTWDPKPEAGYDYCGALANSINTNVDGIKIGFSTFANQEWFYV